MPKYVYADQNGHRKELTQSISQLDKGIVLCDECDLVMHRVPQVVAVNWNGLPPHLEDARPPQIKKYVKETPNRIAQWRDGGKEKLYAPQKG